MDYKKAYEEAIKRAKAMVEVAEKEEEAYKSAITIFPELAKSEDERIREDLLAWLKDKQANPSIGFSTIKMEQWVVWLEKQGESKSAEEVEPKFHEGEWITNGDYTWKIVEVKPLDYILQSQDGNIIDDTISYVDEHFHSFTIKDARDGDVLALSYASQNYILIYKGLNEKDFDTMMSVFCSYYVEENTYDDETDSFHAMNRGEIITPATKEQRDTLMKAMTDAGYTFDFEKKELKRIEQSKLTEFEDSVKGMMDAYRDAIGVSDATTEEVKKHAAYMLSLIPHKPATWSEYDEKNLEKTIWYVEKGGKLIFMKTDELVSWLKSLKNKVAPQKQWKPSDEQIKACKKVYADILSAKGFDIGTINNELNRLEEELKKLREE